MSDGGASAAAVLACVHGLLAEHASTVLLIDGRSGAGKTTLAAWLTPRLHARSVSMEGIYRGWRGLDAGVDLLSGLLAARAAGRPATWRGWDWSRDRPGAVQALPPAGALIVEGVGCSAVRAAGLAAVRIRLDVDPLVRGARVVRRDPPESLPFLRRWAADERRLAARSAPVVDLVLRGGVRMPPGGPATDSGDASSSHRIPWDA